MPVHQANRPMRGDKRPMTTKLCPHCGHDVVVPLRSLNSKICNGCKKEFPWSLDPGQKPLLAPSRADRRPPEAAEQEEHEADQA